MQYKFSVIIPAFNCAESISKTVESIKNQTLGFSEIELIIVDDGSTDDTNLVLKRLQNDCDNIVIINKSNGGVSSARNTGIRRSTGKYIAFVDADDELSDNYLSDIYKLFENSDGSIDICVSDIVYSNGRHHWRYDYLNGITGIFDIEDKNYAVITTMNISIRNMYSNNELFDERLIIHEDEEFSSRILLKKKKFGFCAEAKYVYDNKVATSATNTKLNPYYSFDQSVKMYVQLIKTNKRNGNLERYIQALIVNDLLWKLKSNTLFSINDDIREKQLSKILPIINDIDEDILLNHPQGDLYHKHYFLSMKSCNRKIGFQGSKLMLKLGKESIHVKDNVIYISSLRGEKEFVKIKGFFKNYITSYCNSDDIKIFALADGNVFECRKRFTYFNYHRCRTLTNNFVGFEFDVYWNKVKDLDFFVTICGKLYKINRYGFSKFCLDKKSYLRICFNSGCIVFDVKKSHFIVESNCNKYCVEIVADLKKDLRVGLVDIAALFARRRKIWIYSDREGVKDNALIQFLADRNRKDGVKRFYVSEDNNIKKDLIENQKILPSEIIDKRSLSYQIRYLGADKIITSFVDQNFYMPIGINNYKANYANKFRPEVIYLQHGCLHAKTIHYAEEFLDVAKVVISTKNEEILFKELGFSDKQLIKTGAPRYHGKNKKSLMMDKINNILYLPSWRSYLATVSVDNIWSVNENRVKNSNFGKGILDLFLNEKLKNLLKNNSINVDIKLHPLFMGVKSLFNDYQAKGNSDINIVDEADIENYDLIITDYSSVVYDAVFEGKPIVYYCPDYYEFKGGLNLYCDTSVPMENGFGPLVTNINDLVKAIEQLLQRPVEYYRRFAEIYSKTFFEITNSCDRLYEEISK